VHHRRTLLSVGGEYWVCVDTFTGEGSHRADFRIHLAPGLEVESTGASWFAAPPDGDAGLLVAPVGFENGRSRVAIGEIDPIEGWHSDDYGDRRPAPTLLTTDQISVPAVRAYVLVPCCRAAHAEWTVERQQVADGLALTVRNDGMTDVVLCSLSRTTEMRNAGLVFTGELLHARLDKTGELRRFLAVQARSLGWNGESMIETKNPVDWVVNDRERMLERA
jgi:hypothetical protein